MYLSWAEKTITDFADENINDLYDKGFVFTRVSRGVMNQTRSLRIDLSKFTLSSENRRVLKKTENIKITPFSIPFREYTWTVGKLGKDFYKIKFGEGTFSANKIKELMTDSEKSNFNTVFLYENDELEKIGFCIAKESDAIIHYCYPFYKLDATIPNLGLGMMLKTIDWAQKNSKKYVYLGSFQRPTDTYKLQFAGLEWFNGKTWQTDQNKLKKTVEKV